MSSTAVPPEDSDSGPLHAEEPLAARGRARPLEGPSPNGTINAEGDPPFAVSELKVLGTYRVPVWGGFNVSGIYRYHSGRTWERQFRTADSFTIRAEPRGSRRLAAIASLDLRAEKTWRGFNGSGMIGFYVDVFNLTNEGTATDVLAGSGEGFGEPLAIDD